MPAAQFHKPYITLRSSPARCELISKQTWTNFMKVIHTQKEILQSTFFWPSLGTNCSIWFSSAGNVFLKRSAYPFKGFVFLDQNEKRPTSFLPFYVLPHLHHRNPQTLFSLTRCATWVKWFNLFKDQFPPL